MTPQALMQAIEQILSDASYRQGVYHLQRHLLKYQEQAALFPPRVGAEQILHFLDHPEHSYFPWKQKEAR